MPDRLLYLHKSAWLPSKLVPRHEVAAPRQTPLFPDFPEKCLASTVRSLLHAQQQTRPGQILFCATTRGCCGHACSSPLAARAGIVLRMTSWQWRRSWGNLACCILSTCRSVVREGGRPGWTLNCVLIQIGSGPHSLSTQGYPAEQCVACTPCKPPKRANCCPCMIMGQASQQSPFGQSAWLRLLSGCHAAAGEP